MSTTNIIIGIALGILFGGLIIALRHRQRDVFAVIFVVGIAALAIAVNIFRVQQYWENQSSGTATAQSQPAATGAPAAAPPKPMAFVPPPSPLMRGPTGSAAPPAAENPYAGR